VLAALRQQRDDQVRRVVEVAQKVPTEPDMGIVCGRFGAASQAPVTSWSSMRTYVTL
jgi:hypothetical protein